MSKSKPQMETLQPYEAIFNLIPHRISKRQLINMSETGRFPAYVKAYPRATPLWREGDVVDWIAANYGEVLPHYCDRLEREGFNCPPFNGKSV
jgi:hypothetical protein